MLKPHIALALIATICYAISGVITDRFLAKNHALWIQLINNGFVGIITFFCIAGMHAVNRAPELKTHPAAALGTSLVAGIVLFGANYAFYQAFHEGGTLPEITTILCLLPVFSFVFGLPFVPREDTSLTQGQTIQVVTGITLVITGVLVLAFVSKK
jgi:drug/metabolite transporter (DMT)-like permease